MLLNGGKVAGILLESLGQRRGVAHLAIGIGVNLVAAPGADEVEPGALRPVSLLSETGVHVEPEAFLELLASAYAEHEARFVTYGFAPLREFMLSQTRPEDLRLFMGLSGSPRPATPDEVSATT